MSPFHIARVFFVLAANRVSLGLHRAAVHSFSPVVQVALVQKQSKSGFNILFWFGARKCDEIHVARALTEYPQPAESAQLHKEMVYGSRHSQKV
jgi:hypothetical protein